MSTYFLSFEPAIELYGGHDPIAAIFADGSLEFAVEEQHYAGLSTRSGRSPGTR